MNKQIMVLQEETVLRSFLEKVDCLFPVPPSKYYNLDDFSRKIMHHGTALVWKSADNEICGGLLFYHNDLEHRTAYISLLAVLPAYHHQGIATALLAEALAICNSSGMQKVCLRTQNNNTKAILLYQKSGFVASGESILDGRVYYTYHLKETK